ATVAAVALSLRLVPAAAFSLRPLPTLHFLGYFLGHSLLAGVDVARRILGPAQLRQPALRRVSLRLPPAPQRGLQAGSLGLLPGTVMVEFEAEALLGQRPHEAMPLEREVRQLEDLLAAMFSLPLVTENS